MCLKTLGGIVLFRTRAGLYLVRRVMTGCANSPIAAADVVDNPQVDEVSYGARHRARFHTYFVSEHFVQCATG